jgi:hypothetical protein
MAQYLATDGGLGDMPDWVIDHKIAIRYHTTPDDVVENWPAWRYNEALALMAAEARAEKDRRLNGR